MSAVKLSKHAERMHTTIVPRSDGVFTKEYRKHAHIPSHLLKNIQNATRSRYTSNEMRSQHRKSNIYNGFRHRASTHSILQYSPYSSCFTSCWSIGQLLKRIKFTGSGLLNPYQPKRSCMLYTEVIFLQTNSQR